VQEALPGHLGIDDLEAEGRQGLSGGRGVSKQGPC
jgi:hypothetical protein